MIELNVIVSADEQNSAIKTLNINETYPPVASNMSV